MILYPSLGLRSVSFSQTKIVYAFLSLSIARYMSAYPTSFDFIVLTIFGKLQLIDLFVVEFSPAAGSFLPLKTKIFSSLPSSQIN
jgi:hypothetical protein